MNTLYQINVAIARALVKIIQKIHFYKKSEAFASLFMYH